MSVHLAFRLFSIKDRSFLSKSVSIFNVVREVRLQWVESE